MTNYIQVTVAVDSEEVAHNIAETLVERRLAASCWVSGPVISRYWWKGKVEKAQEWVCTAKTRTDLYDQVEQALKEVHPYEVPGILATSVVAGSQSYFNWIDHETVGNRQQSQSEGSKEQLIQELAEAHEALITEATLAFERGASRTEEMWGPREILAHVAGWEAMAVARIPQIIAGVPPVRYATPEQHETMDNAINATVITLLGNQPFEAARDILRQTYQRDIQMLKELDDALFVPGNYVHQRTLAAIDHCHEHIAGLKQLAVSNKG